MSVNVLNTSSGVNGKTLVIAESPAAITGLFTFNRGANPPFAVAAASTKVANLIADKLDDQEGSYYSTADNLTGAMPAISGALLTALNAGNISAGTLANARLNAIVPPTVSVLADGATPALDASLGNVFTLAAAGDRTIGIPSNPVAGQKIIIVHTASGGARTLALNSGAGGFAFGTDITALTQTASGKIDLIGCIYNSAAAKWLVVAYVKGY